MALEQAQAQVGGVTMGTNIPNPIDSASAGVQTGAEWALRNHQVQTQMQMMQAQAQQLQLENMKTRYAIGTTLYERMQRIARLPMGNAKNSEIDLLGNDMGNLGMTMHPSAVALMKDKELSKGLGTVLNGMTTSPGEINPQTGKPYSPQEAALARVQAISALPDFLSSDKILDIYQEAQKTRASMRLKQAEFNQQGAMEQYKQGQENSRQDQKLKQERDMFGVKSTGELRGEMTKDSEEYRKWTTAYGGLIGALSNTSGTKDKVAITMMNQMLGNPTLRQYEAQMFGEGAGFIDNLKARLGGVLKGTSLGPKQRAQIKAAAQDMKAVADRAAWNKLQPGYNAISKLGADPTVVVGPDLQRLLGLREDQLPAMPGFTPSQGSPQPGGTSRRQGLPRTSTTPTVPGAQPGMNSKMVFDTNELKGLGGMIATGAPAPAIIAKIEGWRKASGKAPLTGSQKAQIIQMTTQRQAQPATSPSPTGGQ
jgi:hypothetical protein